MNNRPVIAVDLDGTILSYDPPSFPDLGEPLPGAIEGLQAIQNLGYKILIYTCRLKGTPEEVGAEVAKISKHLTDRGVPFDELFLPGAAKPMAEWYVDDKGLSFQGDWNEIVEIIADKDMVRMAARVASTFLKMTRSRSWTD